MKQPKIAFAHDFLNQTGGGERVLETLHEIWPQAEVYTSIYDQEVVKNWLHIPAEKIHTNFIQKLPFSRQLSKHYFFLYPAAFWLQEINADIVISISSFASKFVSIGEAGV